MKDKVVGLWLNKSKPEVQTLASQIKRWFQVRGWDVSTDWEEVVERRAQFLISLGGDGTLLQAAREGAPLGIPVFGVNFGRLGFLCEIEREDVFSALEKVLSHDFEIQERLMLNALIKREDAEDFSRLVLNDVVFSRHCQNGIITLQVNLSEEPLVSYPADGLIIATPTGSTAYSLSAGGPIISPNVEAILVTPLAAHSLSARPMLVSAHEELKVLLVQGEHCLVTFDGRHSLKIGPGETVLIQSAPLKAQLIRVGSRSFPQVVREKLRDRWHE